MDAAIELGDSRAGGDRCRIQGARAFPTEKDVIALKALEGNGSDVCTNLGSTKALLHSTYFHFLAGGDGTVDRS